MLWKRDAGGRLFFVLGGRAAGRETCGERREGGFWRVLGLGSMRICFEEKPFTGRSGASLNGGIFRGHEKSPDGSGLEWAERGRAVLLYPESDASGYLFLRDIRDLDAGGRAVFRCGIIAFPEARQTFRARVFHDVA